MSIKRYSLVPIIGDGLTPATAFRPDTSSTPGTYVVIATQPNNARCVIKQTLPNGTAMVNAAESFTLCDLLSNQSDFDALSLTAPQKNTIHTWLVNHSAPGAAVTYFDNNVTTRKDLLVFIIRVWWGYSHADNQIRTGWDVA